MRTSSVSNAAKISEFWNGLTKTDIEGVLGYVPANHVENPAKFEETGKWQDDEYFESYWRVVMGPNACQLSVKFEVICQ